MTYSFNYARRRDPSVSDPTARYTLVDGRFHSNKQPIVGSKVRIIGELGGHGFGYWEVVQIIEVRIPEYPSSTIEYLAADIRGTQWWIFTPEFELL